MDTRRNERFAIFHGIQPYYGNTGQINTDMCELINPFINDKRGFGLFNAYDLGFFVSQTG